MIQGKDLSFMLKKDTLHMLQTQRFYAYLFYGDKPIIETPIKCHMYWNRRVKEITPENADSFNKVSMRIEISKEIFDISRKNGHVCFNYIRIIGYDKETGENPTLFHTHLLDFPEYFLSDKSMIIDIKTNVYGGMMING